METIPATMGEAIERTIAQASFGAARELAEQQVLSCSTLGQVSKAEARRRVDEWLASGEKNYPAFAKFLRLSTRTP